MAKEDKEANDSHAADNDEVIDNCLLYILNANPLSYDHAASIHLNEKLDSSSLLRPKINDFSFKCGYCTEGYKLKGRYHQWILVIWYHPCLQMPMKIFCLVNKI